MKYDHYLVQQGKWVWAVSNGRGVGLHPFRALDVAPPPYPFHAPMPPLAHPGDRIWGNCGSVLGVLAGIYWDDNQYVYKLRDGTYLRKHQIIQMCT